MSDVPVDDPAGRTRFAWSRTQDPTNEHRTRGGCVTPHATSSHVAAASHRGRARLLASKGPHDQPMAGERSGLR